MKTYKTTDYKKAFKSWLDRLNSRNVSVENAYKRLEAINLQLESTFEDDVYLSKESRKNILIGRKDVIIAYVNRLDIKLID